MSVTALRKFTLSLCVICTILSLFIIIPMAVVTSYWHPYVDCILYATVADRSTVAGTSRVLKGSYSANCDFVTFAPVASLVVGALAAVWEYVRIRSSKREIDDLPRPLWHWCAVGLCAAVTVLMLVVACMLSHGYNVTCEAMRKNADPSYLFPSVRSINTMYEFVTRLRCSFYYDAFDYGLHLSMGGQDSVINTDAALEIAMAAAWLSFIAWSGIVVLVLFIVNKLKVAFPRIR